MHSGPASPARDLERNYWRVVPPGPEWCEEVHTPANVAACLSVAGAAARRQRNDAVTGGLTMVNGQHPQGCFDAIRPYKWPFNLASTAPARSSNTATGST